ncbi:MAG TPA: glycosyltransferase family 4 protein [Burkholderiales bacterium]|nr:glycosyltransferase family 4 protein [Burkholderiales bacterium]
MKILTFSTLYPNAARPRHGIFVETQLRQQLASGQVESMVVAPVPWFPSRNPRFGEYAVQASAPREERRHGIQILHPRYLVLPKIGMTLAPFLLAQSLKPVIKRVLAEYRFDLIDAHYFYPDGVAAVLLGRHFGKPVVITALGTDVNLISSYRLPRRMILWAARHAAGIITVARALKDKLVALGVPAGRIEVLRNGVDLELFRPVDRETWRSRFGFRRTTLLSVGNLVPLKGHDLAIRALRLLPEMDLVIIGDGPERTALGVLAHELGVADRVTFHGVMGQEDLRHYFGAADALVLASSREGWANVLLESMACGTPVIASRVGGTPEVVTAPEAGLMMAERTPEALADAVRRLFENYPDRGATRRFAEGFSWAETTAGQLRLFGRILQAADKQGSDQTQTSHG